MHCKNRTCKTLMLLLSNSAVQHNITDGRFPRLIDCFASYFGSFTCVTFSADSKLVLVSKRLVSLFVKI